MAALLSLPALAQDFSYTYEGQTVNYTVLSDTEVSTKAGIGVAYGTLVNGDLVLPAHPMDGDKEYNLTKIAEKSFYNNEGLTSVSIPETVTSIGTAAFTNCIGLTKAEFADMESLCSIEFGNDVANPLYYAHNLYIAGELVTEPQIPDGITNIKNYTFCGCRSITSVQIPGTVTSLGFGAFANCRSLISVILPPSVTALGNTAFQNCSGLLKSVCPDKFTNPFGVGTVIRYPAGDAVVENGVVYSLDKTTLYFVPITTEGAFEIPSPVAKINKDAFRYCNDITSVTIPESVTSIDNDTFKECTGLTSVSLPNTLTTIGANAFNGCTALTAVTIPEAVTSIDSFAFLGCDALETLNFNAENCTKCGGYSYGSYYDVFPASIKTLTIGEKVKSVPNLAFRLCDAVETFNFNAENCTVLSIGSFKASIKSATLGDKVTNLPNDLFNGFTTLTDITLPASLTTIGNNVFNGCTGLTSIVMPEAVSSIGTNAFSGCTGVTTAEFASLESLCAIKFGNENSNPLKLVHDLNIAGEIITDVVIPETVTSIGGYAFTSGTGINSVEIPGSVTSIGYGAFSDCTGLISVVIPPSVTTLGGYAFIGCTNLKKSAFPSTFSENPFSGMGIKYPAEGAEVEDGIVWGPDKSAIYFVPIAMQGDFVIPSTVTKFDPNAFRYCNDITSVTVPESLTQIDGGLFQGCTGLTSVSLPNTLTSIGSSAFNGCTGLTEATIPEAVTSVGYSAFLGCTSLETLNFNAESCLSCGGYSWGSYDLVFPPTIKTINVGEKLKTISGYAFAGLNAVETLNFNAVACEDFNSGFYRTAALKTVTIGDKVTKLPVNFLNGCTGITEVIIPASVTTIGNNVFNGCTGLTSIKIPATVETIGGGSFGGCTGLQYAEFESIESICSINFNNGESNPLSAAKNLRINGENITDVEIPEAVTSIGKFAFYDFDGMTSVHIPNSVTNIGENAFMGCDGLTAVTVPGSVTTVGNSAFNGCANLQQAILGNNVTSLGSYVFSGCGKLIRSAYPSNLGSPFGSGYALRYNREGAIIEDGWVWGPDKSSILFAPVFLAGEYEIPSTVTTIGDFSFRDCKDLTSVVFPNSLTSIGFHSFRDCTGLTQAFIPNSVTSISTYAFAGCTGLTEAIVPASVTTLGDTAFSGCTGIKKAAYPSTLRNPFGNGTIINYPAAGSEVENGFVWGPDKSAVYYAPLTLEGDYEIPETVTTVGTNAFAGCTLLSDVTLPEGLATLGASAFAGIPDLKTIYYKGSTPIEAPQNVFDSNVYENATLDLGDADADPFKEVSPWKYFYKMTTGVEGVISGENGIDTAAPCEVYNINGVHISDALDNLAPGIYIVRQSGLVRKIAVK